VETSSRALTRKKLEEFSAPHPLPRNVSVQAALVQVLQVDIVPLSRVSLKGSSPGSSDALMASSYFETLAERLDRTYGPVVRSLDVQAFNARRVTLGCDVMTPVDRRRADPVRIIQSSLSVLGLYAVTCKEAGMPLISLRFTQLLSAMQDESCVVAGDLDGRGHWIAFVD